MSVNAEELRTFIGKRVRVLRDTAEEGRGELVDVIPGTFEVWNDETQQADPVNVGDKELRWIDDKVGDLTAARRYGNVWRLEELAS